jgi:hypothetical protein
MFSGEPTTFRFDEISKSAMTFKQIHAIPAMVQTGDFVDPEIG